ncbi:expressed unknown protein [Seminavis robusta]|uniref:Uncharacterized protein n=1 Tax=Seminavis robusta TaxID=568900 RepID=A0A9N8HPE1_9STRA|nr:expressed unknown protein [Seminavis robusta]|eukprot:Sro1061_g236760.1 n/a (333) ;mRNA; f:3011-4009
MMRFQVKPWGSLALLLLTCSALMLRPLLASNKNRALRASENIGRGASVYKGNVTIDFYRMFEEKRWLGIIPYKDYTMSRFQMAGQIHLMNFWLEGRVNFILGDIYEIDDPFYYDNPSDLICGDALNRFANRFSGQDQIKNVDRINVLVVPKLGRNINGCATLDVPLGGNFDTKAPAFVLTRDNTIFYSIGPFAKIGFQNLLGNTVSHEAGHVFGLRHTDMDGDNVPRGIGYFGCGLNLRYPQFRQDQVLSGDFKFWDEVSGELYTYEDWHGQSNFMASGFSIGGLFLWKAGIFRYNYEPIFDQILECWFSRSYSRNISDDPEMGETIIIEDR